MSTLCILFRTCIICLKMTQSFWHGDSNKSIFKWIFTIKNYLQHLRKHCALEYAMCIFLSKVCIKAALKCSTLPSPCSQGSRECWSFVAATFDNHCRNNFRSLASCGKTCWSSHLVNSYWVGQKKLFLWKHSTGNVSVMLLWQCKELCVLLKHKFPNIILAWGILKWKKDF